MLLKIGLVINLELSTQNEMEKYTDIKENRENMKNMGNRQRAIIGVLKEETSANGIF